jgi:hypothetical protein
MIGTPLQAVKFALTLNTEDLHPFLNDWSHGLQEYWENVDGVGFDVFCKANLDLPERADGRKVHYGAGKQPIDTIKELGWGAQFMAGNVLKYLRRDKDLEHSLQSARVYFGWLRELAITGTPVDRKVHEQLINELNLEEITSVGIVA